MTLFFFLKIQMYIDDMFKQIKNYWIKQSVKTSRRWIYIWNTKLGFCQKKNSKYFFPKNVSDMWPRTVSGAFFVVHNTTNLSVRPYNAANAKDTVAVFIWRKRKKRNTMKNQYHVVCLTQVAIQRYATFLMRSFGATILYRNQRLRIFFLLLWLFEWSVRSNVILSFCIACFFRNSFAHFYFCSANA